MDAAIGQMVEALENEHLLDSTTIIITAKHGQSPIDPNRFFPIPGHSELNGEPPSAASPRAQPAVPPTSSNSAWDRPKMTSPSFGCADETAPLDAVARLLEANGTASESARSSMAVR